MKKSLISLAAGAVVGLTVASAAYATPIYLDNAVDYGPNGSTQTSAIKELGYTGTIATSFYLGNPAVAGTQVVDTNVTSVMNSLGFTSGAHTAIDTVTSLTTYYPTNPDNLNVNSLNNLPAVADKNGFTDGEGIAYGTQIGTAGKLWGLTYSYTMYGVTTATDVKYNSGYFDVFYNSGDANNGKQLLRMLVTGSEFQLVNLAIFGTLDYTFADGSDPWVQNFFHDTDTGNSFYQNYLANVLSVSWIIDSNVNPALPTANQLFYGNVDLSPEPGNQFALIRQTSLDGSIAFNVPEPGSLALLGLGLAGLGLAQRRRKAAK